VAYFDQLSFTLKWEEMSGLSVVQDKVLQLCLRPIVNIRKQLHLRRFSLVLGAGVSKEFGIPDWDKLIERIAGDKNVEGKAILKGTTVNLSHASRTQMLFHHFKAKSRDTWLGENILTDDEIRVKWRKIVRKQLYKRAKKEVRNIVNEQISKGKRSIWKTDAITEENPLYMISLDGELCSSNLCIKINLMSEDNNSFCSYIKKSGLSYRVLLEVSPPNYPYIISNGQAVAIANQLVQQIKRIHAKYGTNSVHIFAAIPFGLALLIGYNLNACGKIQSYEFDNPSREYFPSCVLDDQ
jgi:hypothetical protein